MRKVSGGKIYDTKKAEVVAEWSNHYYRNDFHYCEETLYRTDKGNWFLYGEGGAMSKYREPSGSNSWGGGEGITPLTTEEAYAWLEEHDRVKEIEEYFQDKLEEA
jgi:hypothetical protein